MTRAQATQIRFLLEKQIKLGFERIAEMEKEGKNGLEHTAMREQLNGLIKMFELLQYSSPFNPADWSSVILMLNDIKKKFSWLGWL